MTLVILLALGLVSIGFLLRVVLVLSGRLKSVILRLWEHYSPAEPIFDPVAQMCFWTGMVMLSLGLIVTTQLGVDMPVYLVGVAGMVYGYWRSTRPPSRSRAPFPLPIWHADLVRRTTREERRHIAWRWLFLPDRTRRALSDNDAAFRLWADLMIVSTVQHTHEFDLTERESNHLWETWQ